MGFGDLFSKSWGEYKNNFGIFFKIFLLLSLIPEIIFSIIIYSVVGFNFQSTDLFDFISVFSGGTFIFLVMAGIIIFVLNFIMMLSFIYLAIYQKTNVSMNFGQTIKGGLGYFWNYILLSLLLIVCLIPLFLLLVIPGLVFAIYWAFSPYVLIKENLGPWESMKKSKSIVKGKWWRVFGYSILLGIIMFLITVFFRIPEFIFKLVLGFSSVTTLSIGLLTITSLVGFLSSLITIPLSLLFMKNFYLNLKDGLVGNAVKKVNIEKR